MGVLMEGKGSAEQVGGRHCANCRTQDDWDGWIAFNSKIGEKVQTVGDDLTVTNIKRIKTAAERGACNALLLKVGTA